MIDERKDHLLLGLCGLIGQLSKDTLLLFSQYPSFIEVINLGRLMSSVTEETMAATYPALCAIPLVLSFGRCASCALIARFQDPRCVQTCKVRISTLPAFLTILSERRFRLWVLFAGEPTHLLGDSFHWQVCWTGERAPFRRVVAPVGLATLYKQRQTCNVAVAKFHWRIWTHDQGLVYRNAMSC